MLYPKVFLFDVYSYRGLATLGITESRKKNTGLSVSLDLDTGRGKKLSIAILVKLLNKSLNSKSVGKRELFSVPNLLSTKDAICTPIAGHPMLPKPQCICIILSPVSFFMPNVCLAFSGNQVRGILIFLTHLSISSCLNFFCSSSSPRLANIVHSAYPSPPPPITTAKALFLSP